MTPIEGLLVWSSLALTPMLRVDNTRGPSMVAITTFLFLKTISFSDNNQIKLMVMIQVVNRK